jgi:SAM-dependent methyltransferase
MTKFIYKLIPDWFKIIIFKIGGGKPWGKGYLVFKLKYIKKIINDQQIIKKFRNKENLPQKYGYALDERVVEYPWILSKIFISEKINLLDAGSALNFKEILNHDILKNKKITIVNLNPEENCFWQKGISYVFADIRDMPFKNNLFDLITCISTLEHVGMDNILYTKNLKYKEKKVFDFEKAIFDLKRVLKKGGRILITVPFGKYQNFNRFQQFDSNLINKVIKVFQPKNFEICYYKYTKNGWNVSDEQSFKNCEYFDILNTKYFDKKNSLGFDLDYAAASRAIACLELIK